MSALGEATFIWPKPKEAVELCMDVSQQAVNGKIVYDVSCPNCIKKGVAQPKSWRLAAAQGLGNAWIHFRACIDDDAALEQMIKAARHAKAESQRAKAKGRGDPPPPPSGQATLGSAFVVPNQVKSLKMWIDLIVKKGMAISEVECPVMQEHVKHPYVKDKKTVMDTIHRLVMLVEKKIAAKISKAPKGQLIFDGYTVGGQHYVALFASCMEPYKVTKDG